MKRFSADLHIHSCLSPCSSLDMTPLRIVDRALELGLDIIAIADHNSAENVAVAAEVAEKKGLCLVPAMEVASAEEVHVLALFSKVEAALDMQAVVYSGLSGVVPVGIGHDDQVLVNDRDEVLGFCERPLIGASAMVLDELVSEVRSRGGLAVASHVDREAFGVFGQLGFIPDGVAFDAFEVVSPIEAGAMLVNHPGIPWVRGSDAHGLDDIGKRRAEFEMREPTFEEIRLAFAGVDGRRVTC